MKIRVTIDRNTALMAGKDKYGYFDVEIPVAKLSDEQRNFLKILEPCDTADFDLGNIDGAEPSVETVIAEIDKRIEKYKRKQADHFAEIEKIVEIGLDGYLRDSSFGVNVPLVPDGAKKYLPTDFYSDENKRVKYASFSTFGQDGAPFIRDSHRQDDRVAKLVEQGRELDKKNEKIARERAKEIEEKLKREMEPAIAKYKDDLDRFREEKLTWAKKHGSERLQKCLTENIECDAIYKDEKLAHDCPGWAWAGTYTTDSSFDEPRNPDIDALDLLDEARKSVPDLEVELKYVCVEEPINEEDYCCEEPDVWRGYVATAEYMGQTIEFAPEDLKEFVS